MRLMILGLFLVLACSVVSAEITEIMYNPEGKDNNKEYVEVVFDVPTNIGNWTIVSGDDSSDFLELFGGDGLSKINLIVEEEYDVSSLDLDVVSVYSIGKAIGKMGLKNTGDSISLYENENLVFSANYDDSMGNGNGMAVCYLDDAYECEPSPGEENEYMKDEEDNVTYEDEPGENEDVGNGVEEESYVVIDYLKSNNNESFYFCESFNVGIRAKNNGVKKEKIVAYVMGFGDESSVKINPHKGQTIELPVIACSEDPMEGEYALVLEGFGNKDMRIIYFENKEVVKVVESEPEVYKDYKNEEMESDIKTSFSDDSKEEIIMYDSETSLEKKIAYYLTFLVAGLALCYVVIGKWKKKE